MSYQQGGGSQIPVRDVRQEQAAERARLAALSRPSHLDKFSKEGARKVPVDMPEEQNVRVPVTHEPSSQQQQQPSTFQQPMFQQPLQTQTQTQTQQQQQQQLPVYSRTEPTRPARAGLQQPVMQQPVMQQPVMQQPVMQQPVMQQPVMQQPVMQQQPVQQAAAYTQPLTHPATAPTQTGQHMRTYNRHRHYRYFSSLGSILDPGCEVYTSRGWGYIMKSPDELGGDKVQVKLQYVEGGATGASAAEQNIVELPLNDIEYAAFCGVGNCLSTQFGTGVLTEYLRDTDTHVMRLGGTDREQEGNHVHLERDQIYSVIPSAVGMIAETDFGRGEVHNYWPAQRMFSVLIFGEQQNVLRELNEDQVWTPLAKYVPVAEVISDKGTLKDWKRMFKTIFGNLEEARDRMMEMSRRYFGIDHNDLRNKDTSLRMLFDKVIAHLEQLAHDEEMQREFAEDSKNNFSQVFDQLRWGILEQKPEGLNSQNVMNKLRELEAQLNDAASRDPELQGIVDDFRNRAPEMFRESISKYGTTLRTHEQRIVNLHDRIRRLRSSPQEKELYEVARELYTQMSSEELKEDIHRKSEAIREGSRQYAEEQKREGKPEELMMTFKDTINAILANVERNRGDFDTIFTRMELAKKPDSGSLHDLTVLIRRTFNVNYYGQQLGDRLGKVLKLSAFAAKGGEMVQRTPQAQGAQAQLKQAVSHGQQQLKEFRKYFRETFMGSDETGEGNVRVPELEEILYQIYSREEELRGREISGQELIERFSDVYSAYNAATGLVKIVLSQAADKLGDRDDTRELKRILREIAQRRATGQDVMDLIVLVLQLNEVAPSVPRALDTIEQIVRRLETIAQDETFKAALSKSHLAGAHQKLLEDFRGIDEELLKRAAASGGADVEARNEIINRFKDAVIDFLSEVLPNTPLPDVYRADDRAEVAVGNMRFRELNISKENVMVQVGGRSSTSTRPHTVNSLPDDTVFSLKTRAVDARMDDVVWKVRQLTFPFTRAHGLADADIRDLSINIGFKLVRIAMANLRAIERISGRAFGGIGESTFDYGNQAPEAALQSEEGDHIMFILKHASVDIGQIHIDLRGSKRAAMLDSMSHLFSNAIRDAIRRQINDKMRENSMLMTGPMNQGLHAGSLKLFVEQILHATVDEVPFVTEGELRQMRQDAEAYRRSKDRKGEHAWEESMREHTFVIDNLAAIELEAVTEQNAQPAAGAWRGGGYIKVNKVDPRSNFHHILEQRQLDRYFRDAVIVGINGVDVRAKSPEETINMLRDADRPLEIKFALDAAMWRKYVNSLGSEAKEIVSDVRSGRLNLTKVRLQGTGRVEVQRDRYMERSYILTNYDDNDLVFTNPLFRMKPNMILYSINGEILLGREYDEVAAILGRVSRPAMLMLLESPVKDVVFMQRPTDMVLAEKNGKIYISDFRRERGVISRASSEIRVGDELFDLDGKPFPGPYGYKEDLRRLRRLHAPATLGVGRWVGDKYQKFDVRITEEGMVDAIFGEGRDGRPYIKGFTDVPGPGASHSGIDRGYIILGINDQEFDRFITPQAVEDMIKRAPLPLRMRVLDTKLFKEIVQARDNEIPLAEAA